MTHGGAQFHRQNRPLSCESRHDIRRIPLDRNSISVNRGERQRQQLKEEQLEELADSIEALGLIHPIVVTRELVLVSGERRLEACRRLGWTHISAQYTDEL